MEKQQIPYLKIGTSYYKIIEQPLASKDTMRTIIHWDKTSIDEDHGKDYRIKEVPRYDSFCFIPDNINYSRVVNRDLENNKNGSYNTYEPIIWIPKEGSCNKILMCLKHIFNDQFEIGLDYLTIIWQYPTQILPILCLVSKERNTGKTTFLKLLRAILGHNMTLNTNEDFRNQFNSGWAAKILIGAEEVLLNKKEDVEKLKNLSTTPLIKSESKGKDKIEQEFYGKFIICSNNETDFINISPEEIRFWVRKIPTLQEDNVNFFEEMKKEIPAFLYMLSNRNIKSTKETRMWFTREQLWTQALANVIKSGTCGLEREIKSLIIDQILNYDLEEVFLTPKDIISLLKSENNISASRTKVTDIICEKWGYKPNETSGYYKKWHFEYKGNNGDMMKSSTGQTGRYYKFPKNDFI